jgi:hypothetical protein
MVIIVIAVPACGDGLAAEFIGSRPRLPLPSPPRRIRFGGPRALPKVHWV